MSSFIHLELPYIFIALFALGIFLFIATRPFISPLVMKRGLAPVVLILVFGILTHFFITQSRAQEVLAAYNNGQTVICSERRDRVGNRFIEISKGPLWTVDGLYFIHTEDNSRFIMTQCLVK